MSSQHFQMSSSHASGSIPQRADLLGCSPLLETLMRIPLVRRVPCGMTAKVCETYRSSLVLAPFHGTISQRSTLVSLWTSYSDGPDPNQGEPPSCPIHIQVPQSGYPTPLPCQLSFRHRSACPSWPPHPFSHPVWTNQAMAATAVQWPNCGPTVTELAVLDSASSNTNVAPRSPI